MSDLDTPAAPDTPAPAPMKKVSGLLIVSVLLTLMGIFMVPVLATVAGLITAVKGRAKAMADPLVIGPRLGMFCIIAAVLALPLNGWQVYGFYDNLKFQEASSEAIEVVFAGLRKRDYGEAFNGIDGSFRRTQTLEAFTAEMTEAFPGEETLVLSRDTITARSEKLSPEDEEAWRAFYGKQTDTLDHTSEIVSAEAEGRTNLDIRIEVRRSGWAKYEVRVLTVRAWLAEETVTPDPTKTPENPGPEKGSEAADPEKTPAGNGAEDAPKDKPK